MSEKNKKLSIIITNSMQNDFIERLDELKTTEKGKTLKLDFLKCQELWINYFLKGQGGDVDNLTAEKFIEWLGTNAKTQNITVPIPYNKILNKYKHRVHIDYDETQRLWEGGKLEQFIGDLTNKFNTSSEDTHTSEEIQCIHLRDWHDTTDIEQKGEMDLFGVHCIKGTYGAKFVSPLDELIKEHPEFNIVINSNSLSSFSETELESVLDTIIKNAGSSKNEVNIVVFGVITNVKIFLLAFELIVIHKFKNVYVCSDFCAGFIKIGHETGISDMTNLLAANVVDHNKIREIFNL